MLQCTNVIVGPSRPFSFQGGDRPVLAPLAVAEVAGDPEAELFRERPVELRDLHRRELVAARRQEQRDQRVVRRQAAVANPADVVGRVRHGTARRLPVLEATPCANTTRPPDSTAASTPSVCCGVFRLCDQSTSVVMPESSAS